MIKKTLLAAFLCAANLATAATVVDFSDLTLTPESYHNNPAFTSGGAGFNNFYDTGFGSWAGFAYSNMTAITTPGWGNQYSSAAPASGIYGVGYMDTYNEVLPTIALPLNITQPISISITNTAYTYYAIKDGDAFSVPFEEGDWFKLSIEGKSSTGVSLGVIDFYLADYRSPIASNWYVINAWSTVDLTSLGDNVASLVFTLDSSDVGAFGINTPTYFAMDNLVLIPEPGTIALLFLGLGFVGWKLRRRQVALR